MSGITINIGAPARYAQWTINNIKYLNPSIDPSQYHVFNSNGTLNWSELNRLEGDIGGGYSHELAPFGTQDYYEITGKYPQFSHGWDTANQSDTDYHICNISIFMVCASEGGCK